MKWRVNQILGGRDLEIAQFLAYPDARLFVNALIEEESNNDFWIELMDNVETKSI